ncbi:MAG: hypothetical protein KF884_05080 [Fimbriimonadaceae bacterium]|nr:hypothetical protein [Fimbriimonadaceae bacterium]QYK59458.1 MAG: hypothetical protein KF884_05080 [Fimbriimonadaceae bacterium]
MRNVCCVVLAAILAAPGLAQRGPESQQAGAAVRAVRAKQNQIKYTGIRETQIVTPEGRRIVTERVARMAGRWRTEVVDGSRKGSVAVESERRRLQFYPEENIIREMPPFEHESLMRLMRLFSAEALGRVQVTSVPGPQVAGHMTRQLEARAKGGRVLARAWVNLEHGAVLKLEAFNPTGERITYFEYTSIDFSPDLGPRAFEIGRPGTRIVTLSDELSDIAKDLRLPVLRLPANTRWRLIQVRKLGQGDSAALMQVYQSENQRLSLFLMRKAVNGDRLKRLAGAVNAHTFEREGVHLVLIADVPEPALRRLAATVQHSDTGTSSRSS